MTADLRTALEDLAEDLDGSICTVGYVERELHSLLAAYPPSAQPNRDDIAATIRDAAAKWITPPIEAEVVYAADEVHASLPGRPEHEVKAEALTEAAEVWGAGAWADAWEGDNVDDDISAVQSTTKWLRDRAAQLENGQTP